MSNTGETQKPNKKEAITKAAKRIDDLLLIIDSAKEDIKHVAEGIETDYDFKATMLVKLATMYHRRNKDKLEADKEELFANYDIYLAE